MKSNGWKRRARARHMHGVIRQLASYWLSGLAHAERSAALLAHMQHMVLTHGRTVIDPFNGGATGSHDKRIAVMESVDPNLIRTRENVRVQLEPIKRSKGIGQGYRSCINRHKLLSR